MAISLNLETTGRLQKMLYAIQNPDFRNLMLSIEKVMDADHAKGVIEGKDKDGNTMKPVTYRGGNAVPMSPLVLKRKNRNKETFRNWRFQGPIDRDANDANLSTSEYKKLTGPPLAPRGLNSRIIRNYFTHSGFDGKTYFAEAVLVDILSKKGIPFMQYHFDGEGRLPKRDLRGVRPEGMLKIRKLVALEIRRQFFERD